MNYKNNIPRPCSSGSGNSSREFECERPLKKARYMWQLKGKYYLKNEYKRSSSSQNPDASTSRGIEDRNEDVIMQDIANEPTTDKFQTVTNYTSSSGSSSSKSSSSSHMDLLYRSSANTSSGDLTALDSPNCMENVDEIPLSMVKNTDDHDDYLHKWQTKRIAQSFIDNTINMILENWKISPFDASDLVENCANGGQVEDEGILMAIQSHGLQSGAGSSSGCSSSGSNSGRCPADTTTTISPQKCQPQHQQDPMQVGSHFNGDSASDILFQSTLDNYTNTRNESLLQGDCTAPVCDEDVSLDDATDDMNGLKTDDDSMEFLRTAVSVAIEKKGLSYTY